MLWKLVNFYMFQPNMKNILEGKIVTRTPAAGGVTLGVWGWLRARNIGLQSLTLSLAVLFGAAESKFSAGESCWK